MPACRDLLSATIVFAMLGGASAFAGQPATSSEGPALSGYVGSFDMTETVWSSPGAQPTITTGLVADRHMIGTTLQELLHVAGDAASTAIKRMDLLNYDPVEGRWSYVSLETRAVVPLMSASSFGHDATDHIELTFLPFAIVPPQPGTAGRLLQMREIVLRIDADHDVKNQYFVAADGTGATWLGHRYAYARRPKP